MNDDVDEELSCLCLQQVWNIKLLFLPKQIGSRLWAFWPTYLPSVMSQAVAKIPLWICLGKDEDILLLHPEQMVN